MGKWANTLRSLRCGNLGFGLPSRYRKGKEKIEIKKQIQIGVGDATMTAKGFIDAWKRAERGQEMEAKQRLYFENLEILLKTLTSRRWVLLKALSTEGPMSVCALANKLRRDYKNVRTDVGRLEQVGLIGRTKEDKIEVPWDVVEARLRLAA